MQLEGTIQKDTQIIFANTGREMPATLDFVHECEQRFDLSITWVEYNETNGFNLVTHQSASRNGEPFEALIKKKQYLPNVVTRYCTQELKVKPMKKYLQSIGWTEWVWALGLRFDEPHRWAPKMQNTQREPWYYDFPMVHWKTTKAQVNEFWKNQPFDLQLEPWEGNCDLCFLKALGKRAKMAHKYPMKARWWLQMEKFAEATFDKRRSMEDIMLLSNQISIPFENDIQCFCHAD